VTTRAILHRLSGVRDLGDLARGGVGIGKGAGRDEFVRAAPIPISLGAAIAVVFGLECLTLSPSEAVLWGRLKAS
jgi:hypothetical protein